MSPGISTRLLATQSDERLLALVREGHERAFEALVHRYRRPLLGYCRRLSLPEARAEDVLQQALLKTWLALRDGAEVRDLKAWLYRVVHNTAINAVRDAARDRDRLAGDPTWQLRAGDVGLERGLAARETLAEVAALPQLQREVIVRTAVGGDSHEQVANDLGITDGAVRGLLYRARATLRAAATGLTPPQLANWLAGRAGRAGLGGPAPERLAELTAGGGATAGLTGLALKGGVVVITAGTLITGAAVVRLAGDARAHARAALTAAAPAGGRSGESYALGASAGGARGASQRVSGARRTAPARARSRELGASGPRRGGPVASIEWREVRDLGASRGQPGHRPVAVPVGEAPSSERISANTTPPSGSVPGSGQSGAPSQAGSAGQSAGAEQSAGSGQNAGSDQSAGAGQGGESGGGQGGSGGGSGGAAGSGTSEAGGGGAGGSSGQGSDQGGGAPAGAESGAGATGGAGQGGAGEQASQGESSGSASSSSSGGGLVGAVVHEVVGVVEHLLH